MPVKASRRESGRSDASTAERSSLTADAVAARTDGDRVVSMVGEWTRSSERTSEKDT